MSILIFTLTGSVLAEMPTTSCSNGYNYTIGYDKTEPTVGITKPNLRTSFIDPGFNTCVKRVTDHETQDPNSVSSPGDRYMKNNYSRRNPYNKDSTYAFIEGSQGWWHLYAVPDWSYMRQLPNGGVDTEPVWSAVNSDVFYFLPNHGGLLIKQYTISTDRVTDVVDFTNVVAINGNLGMHSILDVFPTAERVWTKTEGSPSMDGRFWGFQVEDSEFNPLGIMTYDMQENKITATYNFITDGNGIGRPDHVSMSPSGEFLVVSWHVPNQCDSNNSLGTFNNPCGLMVFSRDLATARGLLWKGPHSDIKPVPK